MDNVEFVRFRATPDEKHLGIATILYDKKIFLNFRVVRGAHDGSYFTSAPSFPVRDEEGNEEFEAYFMFESNSEDQAIKKLLRKHIKPLLGLSDE